MVRRFQTVHFAPTPQVLVGACALLLFVGGIASVDAQSSPASRGSERSEVDTSTGEWNSELVGKISASQAAYKDWQEGGLNSMAFTASLDGAAERTGRRWAEAYSLRMALGFINQENREIRKSEDRIRLQANLQYQGEGFFKEFSPTLAGNFSTQFAHGFSYSENPYPDGNSRANLDPPVQTSAFLAPGTFTESLGLTYDPLPQLSVRFGIATKQTVVREREFRVLYGVDPSNPARFEAGGQFSSALDQRLSENIRFRSQLDVFFAYNQLENPPDVVWESTLNMAVNRWISTDVEVVMLYDKDTIDAIQIKEIISVGVSMSLF